MKRKPRLPDRWRWLVGGLCALLLLGSVSAATSKVKAKSALKPAANASKARIKPAAVNKPSIKKSAGNKPRARHGTPLRKSLAPAASSALSHNGSFFGAASFYGYGFQGRLVANGERFDVRGMTAACNRVPLGTWVAVRREDDGRCIIVRVNDRMHVKHQVRVIDLSRGAAEKLRMISAGVVMVRVAPLPGPPQGDMQTICGQIFDGQVSETCASCDAPHPPRLPTVEAWPPDASEAAE